MTSPAIKICGLTTPEAIDALNELRVDYAGFVYYPPSPRHLSLEEIAGLKELLSTAVKTVLVMADPDDALLAQAAALVKPDYLQLHGQEDVARLNAIHQAYPGIGLMKSISVDGAGDVAAALRYTDAVDALVFDAKPPKISGMLPGGNGIAFDWQLLRGCDFRKPWMLSGGLNAGNVSQAVRVSGAKAVDVSSGVESSPGIKDPELIEQFVKAARQ